MLASCVMLPKWWNNAKLCDCGTAVLPHRHTKHTGCVAYRGCALPVSCRFAAYQANRVFHRQGFCTAGVTCRSGEILMHLATLFPASTFVGYDISKRALRLVQAICPDTCLVCKNTATLGLPWGVCRHRGCNQGMQRRDQRKQATAVTGVLSVSGLSSSVWWGPVGWFSTGRL